MSDDYGPHVLLAMLFIITNLFTELITNNAAAALAFPLALSIAAQLGVSPTPFFVVICMAASASFSTPIGYQTNLIVQGIGNYKFMDFCSYRFAAQYHNLYNLCYSDSDDLELLIKRIYKWKKRIIYILYLTA